MTDKRFAKLKLENFPDISSFVVAYQKAIAECGTQPDESFRLTVLTATAIQDNPNIAFHMQKAVEAQASPNSFHFIGELRKCEIFMPKKTATAQTAAAVSEVEEEDLTQRLAVRIAAIQGK